MSKRIVIIGAGVLGLSTAYYCAQRGFEVTVLERNGEQRNGTSFGNAGLIVPSHFIPLAAPGMVALGLKWMRNPASPFYIKPRFDSELLGWGIKFWQAANREHVRRSAPLLRDLLLASRACFEEFAGQAGMDFGLVKKGLLMLCQTDKGWHEEIKTAGQARELGLPAEVLDAKQTAELEPARLNIRGSVYYPKDCHLSPAQFMAALQWQLERRGVHFLWQREAQDFKTGSDRSIRAVVTNDGGTVEADEFVICGGSWSPQLARRLDLNIPIQPGKGYSLTLPNPRCKLQMCSLLTEARAAVTPMGNGLRVGGTMEIAGLNDDINPIRVRGIVESFCRYYSEFQSADFADVQPWSGLRPCSPDGLPYLGRTASFGNLSLATGHAMMGMSLGPISGKLMSEILGGQTPAFDLTMLSPDRYF